MGNPPEIKVERFSANRARYIFLRNSPIRGKSNKILFNLSFPFSVLEKEYK